MTVSVPPTAFTPSDPDALLTELRRRAATAPDAAERALSAAAAEAVAAGREAERRLRRREAQMDLLERLAGRGSWELDLATDTLRWSAEQRRIYGVAEGEEPGSLAAYWALVHPDDRALVAASIAAAQPDRPGMAEFRIVRPDGTVRLLEGRGQLLEGPDGTFTSGIGTTTDVTERRAVERALRASEESYRTIFESSNDAMYVHDVHTGAVLDANRRACEFNGLTLAQLRDDALGHLANGPAPYTPERAMVYLRRAAAGEAVRFEWLSRHPLTGEEVWGEVSLQRVAIGGVDRILAIARDIGERKAAEAALRAANEALECRVAERTAELARAMTEAQQAREEAERQRSEAERANRAKSEFLSRMSHELRTPMNSILGFAQLAARSELPPPHARGVQHILKAGRHLLHLINEVLEIARIEAGRENFSMEAVSLAHALHEAFALVRPLAEQRGVMLPALPPLRAPRDARPELSRAFVHADHRRLVQVLLNLLSNAIKYNRRGGCVQVECGRTADERWALRVADTGQGIAPERLDQLFTPFARLGAEQGEVEGTGLGLALSRRLCEAMGGMLALESSTPDGSVFRIELPPAVDPLDAYEDTGAYPLLATVPGDATLLYVEDNLANLSLVDTILLSRPGWKTVPALQGLLGVELAREHLPDIVLLDLHLPDIPGEEVLRRLRADPRTAHIPIVVVSADATARSLERLRAAGADGYLTKPLDVDEFLRTVERFLPERAR